MICEFKELLMAVQWVLPGFLVAAMIENDVAAEAAKGKGGFELGAGGTGNDDDETLEDEEAVEETSEDEEDRAKQPTKQGKLFAKSQGLADALRKQWKLDEFKMPPGFR
ncbi:MAG: hypothetical protein Q9181_008385 [Wetmoreana brouardii]